MMTGPAAVGKTCLTELLNDANYLVDCGYIPTVTDGDSANLTLSDGHWQHSVAFSFWDSAGQADYDRLRPLSFPGTDIFCA